MRNSLSSVMNSIKKSRWLLVLCAFFMIAFLIYPHLKIANTTIRVPALIIDKPAGVSVNLPVHELEVSLKGPLFLLNYLKKTEIRYPLSLSGINPGRNHRKIDPGTLNIPWFVSIEKINPVSVVVDAEEEVTKIIPVEVVVTGEPQRGFRFIRAVPSVEYVSVKGGRSVVAKLEKVLTREIDLNHTKSSFTVDTSLVLIERVAFVEQVRLINVNIIVNEKIISCVFDKIFIKGINTDFEYKITPNALSLIVEGPERQIDRLDPLKDLYVYLDLNDLDVGVYSRRATINLPMNISFVRVKPEMFTVELNKK